MTGALFSALWKGLQLGRGCLFDNSIMGNFTVYQDRFEINLLQLFAQQDSEFFKKYLRLFAMSILLLNRNKHIGNDLFVFY